MDYLIILVSCDGVKVSLWKLLDVDNFRLLASDELTYNHARDVLVH